MKNILVTKDVNLRMKARSIGILCEDYITDKVVNVDIFEKSNEVFENIEPDLIDRIYSSERGWISVNLTLKTSSVPTNVLF